MKANELMIDDIVTITEPNDFCGYIGKVVIINAETNYIIVHIPNMHLHEVFVEDLQPIQLTEEILHNNGFKNDVLAQKSLIAEGTSNSSVILISEDNRITLNNIDEYLNSFNKWWVHIDNEDMQTMCTAEITYVHELQHLLKLCKIEKEIILCMKMKTKLKI